MSEALEFKYIFHLEEDKGKKEYTVKIDSETLGLINEGGAAQKAEWTNLDFQKCENCPLNSKDTPKCPVALGLYDLIDFFKDDISFTKTKVTVSTPERAYFKESSLQQTLSSILGLIIATSGCPHTTFLKPMARFHLPFASGEETLFRSISTHLLEQFVNGKKEVNLDALDKRYEELGTMNVGLVSRIREVSKGDADRNALIVLNCFTSQVKNEISENLEELKKYFV